MHAVDGGTPLKMVADDEPVPLQLAFPTSPGQDGDLVGLAALAGTARSLPCAGSCAGWAPMARAIDQDSHCLLQLESGSWRAGGAFSRNTLMSLPGKKGDWMMRGPCPGHEAGTLRFARGGVRGGKRRDGPEGERTFPT